MIRNLPQRQSISFNVVCKLPNTKRGWRWAKMMTIIMNLLKREKGKEDNTKDQDQKLLTTKTTHTCSQHWVTTLSLQPTKSKKSHDEHVPHVYQEQKHRVKTNCCSLVKGWEERNGVQQLNCQQNENFNNSKIIINFQYKCVGSMKVEISLNRTQQ